jgi:hypothetical protein
MDLNPLAPDAPIIQHLSIKVNPFVATMSQEQLTEYVKKLRNYATSSPTLTAKLKGEGEKIRAERKPRALTPEQAARRKLLEDL